MTSVLRKLLLSKKTQFPKAVSQVGNESRFLESLRAAPVPHMEQETESAECLSPPPIPPRTVSRHVCPIVTRWSFVGLNRSDDYVEIDRQLLLGPEEKLAQPT